jgi:putative ABC transport system permease protein
MAGKAYAAFVATVLNFELFNQSISMGTWAFQISIGTFLPVLVSFFPIYRASRITVREALNDYGVKENVSLKSGKGARMIQYFKISNITLLAIRNTFRRKGRLVLTLITLVLGGAVFMSAFNIRASLKDTINSRFTNQRYDIQAYFAKGISETGFRSSIDSLPFVLDYESWGYAKGTRLTTDRSESEPMEVKLAPQQTRLFVPEIIKGRWLSGDPSEVVVNHMFLAKYPDVQLGDKIKLKVNGKTKALSVVGCIRELFSGATVYVSKSLLAEWPQMKGKMNSTLIAFKSEYPDMASNSVKLEQWFQTKNYPVGLVFRKDQYKARVVDHLVIITTMLIMVTLLLIIVGGLGLITTMGINIVERIRELAILRAIGVTNRNLYRLTLTEGFIIGMLSWVLSVLVSIPVSMYLGNKFFNIFFETTLNFNISHNGIMIWLGIIIVFSSVAVLIPARNSNKQSVSEGLSYE